MLPFTCWISSHESLLHQGREVKNCEGKAVPVLMLISGFSYVSVTWHEVTRKKMGLKPMNVSKKAVPSLL